MTRRLYVQNLKAAICDWVGSIPEKELLRNVELIKRIERLLKTMRYLNT
jgi:hypothetical protein